MKHEPAIAEVHLTWEIFAEIWQLAVSDRKRLAPHFPFIDKAGLRDDAVFYSAVLERMRSDAAWCKALFAAFQAFPRPKDQQRSFGCRSWRWLKGRIDGMAWDRETRTMQPALETWPPLEREVFDLWAASLAVEDAPSPEGDEVASEGHDWKALVQRMQAVLAGMTRPDPETAQALVALAEDLMVACEIEAAEDELAAALAHRRAELGQSLAALDLAGDIAAVLEGLDSPEAMTDAEGLVADLLLLQHASAQAQDAFAKAEARDRAVGADPAATRPEKRAALDAADAAEAAATTARDALCVAVAGLLAALKGLGGDRGPGETGSFEAEAGGPEPAATKTHDSRAPEPEMTVSIESPVEDMALTPVDINQHGVHAVVPSEGSTSPSPRALPSVLSTDPTDAPTAISIPPAPTPDADPDSDLLDGRAEAVSVSQATDPEPEEIAATWTGRQSLDEVMTQLLDQGELALAWHLTDLAEENGLVPPVPSGLLKSLVASVVLTGPYDAAAQNLGEWLAASVAEVETAEARGAAAGLRARSVALAALLRPALMARDTNARDHLRALSLSDGLQVFAPVVVLLRELRRDLQPSLSDLTELAGGEKKRRLPAALAAIREWLPGARKAQTMHAPSGVILHKFLDVHGDLGQLFEAALEGDIAAVEAGFGRLHSLSTDKEAAEDMVAAAEKEIGRPKRDAIRGMALEWIVRKLREGANLLLDWRSAYHEDQGGDTRRKATLEPQVNALKKELARARRSGMDDAGIDAAVQRVLDRAVTDFLDVVEGRADQRAIRPTEALDAALLRLPGHCQPYAPEDPAFNLERRAQRHALFLALQQPDSFEREERLALTTHLAHNAILPAQVLVERLERQGRLTQAEVQALRIDLENTRYTARETARIEITGLRHDLEPLQSIDLATSPEIQLWLDRLGLIDRALDAAGDYALPMKEGHRSPAIPPDFPHLARLLSEARHLRDRVRNGIRLGQRSRLEDLVRKLRAAGAAELSHEAMLVAESLESRDPITVEDILIRLQNGQSFSLAGEAQEDHFSAFYPGFVSALTSDVDATAIQSAMKSGGAAGPLDFQGLEEHEIKRAVELDANWRAVVNAFQRSRDIGMALRSFMERLGFTSVLIERETQLSAQLRWMWMKADRLSAQDWFLPPVFGSEANGSYPVFLAHRHVEDAQLVAEMAKIGRDAPCILLVLGRLSKTRRESFGLAMRRAKQTVLLIDEAQVLYLTVGGNGMQRLFACATPFGYLQPYTTSAGNIPVEMFFGRETEIAKIEGATADGCLVYGGRQLGKSALLHHVRKRFHQPATGRHAYYLKIDEFGGPVQPAAQIWASIRRHLIEDQILPKSVETPEDIRSAILAWLGKSGERRILLLVDEADLFLSSESRNGFPNLNPLKDLMEETARRFKVVFAGLHNVRRMAKAPNSPLVHLSEPICIGPLNTTPDSSQQARRLVVEPMKAAGFYYENPELIHSLLTRVNFYPSLMQVFLKALLEGLSNQSKLQGAGPRWVLKEEQLFRGPSSEGINNQIRERFQWTLNLDPRYELIAKVLARHRILSADAEGGAMAASAVQHEAEMYWPKGQEKLGRLDFPAFLDEMVDLGVLIRLPGPPVLYGLRGAQVAQMLGQLDQLEDEILKIADKEPRVDYDPNHYRRRVGPDPHVDRRAPLPDQGMAALFDASGQGVRLVIAAAAVLGGDQAQILADMADGWTDGKGRLSGEVFRGQDADLRRIVDRVVGRKVLVLQAQGLKPDWVNWLAAHTNVREGRLLPVVVGAPDAVARLWPRGLPTDLDIFRAGPWERTMLRAWLSDSGLQLLDTSEAREVLLEVSGGAPAVLSQMRQGLDALVAGGRRDDIVGRLRELGRDVAFTPAQVGLPERLVPLFCNAAELVHGDGQQEEETLVDLLTPDNPNARREIGQMTDLGLFQTPEPAAIGLSPLGALLFRACNQPGRPR